MGGGGFGGGGIYFNPFSMFGFYDPYYYERKAEAAALEGAKDMSFLEAVFSFVLGDGDPNRDFEKRRWALVGNCIQKNKGVVTAEQLAPFLERGENAEDESFMLPALTRFQGTPEVDMSTGNIVYRFESMESTAGGGARLASVNEVIRNAPRGFSTGVAEEETYKFSLATQAQRGMVVALGLFNFVGVVVLSRLVMDPVIIMKKAELVAAVVGILPPLQVYALAFFAIPAIRWVVVSRRNAAIEARNQARLEASKDVARPGKLLAAKLEAAKRSADQRTVSAADSVYSSAKDLIDAKDSEAEDFERRLNERNK